MYNTAMPMKEVPHDAHKDLMTSSSNGLLKSLNKKLVLVCNYRRAFRERLFAKIRKGGGVPLMGTGKEAGLWFCYYMLIKIYGCLVESCSHRTETYTT